MKGKWWPDFIIAISEGKTQYASVTESYVSLGRSGLPVGKTSTKKLAFADREDALFSHILLKADEDHFSAPV